MEGIERKKNGLGKKEHEFTKDINIVETERMLCRYITLYSQWITLSQSTLVLYVHG